MKGPLSGPCLTSHDGPRRAAHRAIPDLLCRGPHCPLTNRSRRTASPRNSGVYCTSGPSEHDGTMVRVELRRVVQGVAHSRAILPVSPRGGAARARAASATRSVSAQGPGLPLRGRHSSDRVLATIAGVLTPEGSARRKGRLEGAAAGSRSGASSRRPRRRGHQPCARPRCVRGRSRKLLARPGRWATCATASDAMFLPPCGQPRSLKRRGRGGFRQALLGCSYLSYPIVFRRYRQV
jgi:hypothetical protein